MPHTLQLVNLQVPGLAACTQTLDSSGIATLSGPSGSGKTRLLRAIADLDPHGGTVRLDEVTQHELPAPQWRRQIAFLPAESAWWATTAALHFDVDESRLAALTLQATMMTCPIAKLSTGERQRLSVLRMLANAPRVLLLDEPTASLDHDNALRVEALVEQYRVSAECVVLWVSHDPAQIARLSALRLTMSDTGVCEAST